MNEILSKCVEWDIVNWSKALSFWEDNVDFNVHYGHCLELGARKGGLSLWLAMKGNDVLCSDYEDPGPIASAMHKEHVFPGSIKYQSIDATEIPFENYFDIVVFKSILGGISKNGQSHLRQVVIDQVYKSLKPGGKLLFAENLVASPVHQFFRRNLRHWGNYWNYLDIQGVDELFREYNSVQYNTAGFLGAFGVLEFQRNLLGRLDTLFFDKIASDKMKYIVFGLATK